jgi:hypothetical protein
LVCLPPKTFKRKEMLKHEIPISLYTILAPESFYSPNIPTLNTTNLEKLSPSSNGIPNP